MKTARRNAVDVAVGARIRNLRLRNGLSQTELGGRVGVTFQQVQKYEKGSNRVSASRLAAFAKCFGLPVATFYSEVQTSRTKPGGPAQIAKSASDASVNRLVKAFQALKDKHLKAAIMRLAEEMAGRQRVGSVKRRQI